jgi:predicted DNA-binding transcriptional regulator YafY
VRAARLISMVLLLQARGALTAAELAAELEVSERTVHRDAQALSEAGVPVYAERGRFGGYRLVEGYRTRLTGLDRAQARALFLAGLPDAAREMGLAEAASAARLKMRAALPSALQDAPLAAAGRFHLDAPRWFREAATPPALAAISEAVWGDQVVRGSYARGDGEVRERTVEPYGLVLKAGVWYVVARAGGPGGPFRTYRVDRFAEVAPTGDGFDRDRDFDLPEFWATWSAEFARSLLRIRVAVRLSPAGLRLLPLAADDAAVPEALASAEPPDADGWVRITLPAESLDVVYSQLLRLGPEAEALEPPELRTRLAEAAALMAARYADPGQR